MQRFQSCQFRRAAWLILLVVAPARGQFVFVEVANSRGIGPYSMALGMGGGVAAADYDSDGDVDLFVPTAAGLADQLYCNNGSGQFEDVATSAGLDSMRGSRAALWFDYDNDADLDLLVACDPDGGCWGPDALHLYRQDTNGVFLDVSIEAGLTDLVLLEESTHFGGMCAGDVNNDGFLDLFLTYWDGLTYLLINNQAGGFDDIGAQSGTATLGDYWQPVMHDFNRDGWIDIYQTVDFTANRLWINQHDNTFINVAASAGLDNAFNDMGITLGDYDNDGDLDIYISNAAVGGKHSVFYRNDSTPGLLNFAEISLSLGVDNGYWGWGTTFLDADNDLDLDLAATNGAWVQWLNDPSRFFLNDGGSPPNYLDSSAAVQFDDTEWGSGLIAFDYDRDGDLDLLQVCANSGPLRLLELQPSPGTILGNHLVIKPRVDGPNHFAIGAIVRVVMGPITLTRLIGAGTSFLSQEPAEAFFGMGNASQAPRVIINWPNHTRTVMQQVAANQTITVTHGGYGDHNADGSVDLADLGALIDCLSGPEALPSPSQPSVSRLSCQGVFDPDTDRDVDLRDLAVLAPLY